MEAGRPSVGITRSTDRFADTRQYFYVNISGNYSHLNNYYFYPEQEIIWPMETLVAGNIQQVDQWDKV